MAASTFLLVIRLCSERQNTSFSPFFHTILMQKEQTDKLALNQEPTLELHSRAAPIVEAHQLVNIPDTGRNSGG